jgi:hypothetical protein
MRFYKVLIISIGVILSFACASQQSLNPLAEPDKVVLEITTNASGMVYPREGDILDMRLYESGRFEYDDYPNQDPPKITSANVIITRKESKLNADSVRELIGLAEQPDFLAADDEYPPIQRGVDSQFRKTILFTHRGRQKKIVVVDYGSDDGISDAKSRYPASLLQLVRKVYALKAEAIKNL